MDSEKEDGDDSLSKELGVSSSSSSQKDDTFHQDDIQRENEVLIKPDSKVDLLQKNRKWSPRNDAFFFSKFISFL